MNTRTRLRGPEYLHEPGEGIDGLAERLLRRDRQVVVGGLAFIILIAWVYLYSLSLQMAGMDMAIHESMTQSPWSLLDAWLMLAMWVVMMVAMMLPSATPMILLYARVAGRNFKASHSIAHSAAFLGGYVMVWVGFSFAATVLQFGLESLDLLSAAMASNSKLFTGMLLLAVAVYQWMPVKESCLNRCRSPVLFLSTHWQPGANGAFLMGLLHGSYCLGCCWVLMLLLFAGGVMNLLCIAAISIFVLAEKILPRGRELGKAAALLLAVLGTVVIAV